MLTILLNYSNGSTLRVNVPPDQLNEARGMDVNEDMVVPALQMLLATNKSGPDYEPVLAGLAAFMAVRLGGVTDGDWSVSLVDGCLALEPYVLQ